MYRGQRISRFLEPGSHPLLGKDHSDDKRENGTDNGQSQSHIQLARNIGKCLKEIAPVKFHTIPLRDDLSLCIINTALNSRHIIYR